jgi:hypothetical protein
MEIGLGSSLFIADNSVPTLKSIPSRWKSYLTGWLAPGFSVAESPLDFDCILNESLWFNRFIKMKMENLLVIIKHTKKPFLTVVLSLFQMSSKSLRQATIQN